MAVPLGRRAVLAPLLLIPLVACGGDSGTAGTTFTVRDSAGVRIVENSGPAWSEGEGWVVAEEPDLVIGNDPELPLFEVRRVDVHPDGRIVAAHGSAGEVIVFSPEGDLLHRMGRRGEGPGEFGLIGTAFWYRGDSIAAVDVSPDGLVVFGPDGRLGRDERSLAPMPDGYGQPSVLMSVGDGAFVVQGWRFGSAQPGDTAALRFAVTDASLSPVALSPELDGATCAPMTRGGCGFGPFDFFAALHASREEIVYAFGSLYEIQRFDLAGTRTGILRVDREPIPFTRESLAGYREYLDEGGTSWDSEQLESAIEETGMPPGMPAVAGLRLDVEGHIWAREFDRAQSPGFAPVWYSGPTFPWGVFTREGRYLGRVEIPARLTVYAIGPDFIFGVYKDELDVETIRRYRLERN